MGLSVEILRKKALKRHLIKTPESVDMQTLFHQLKQKLSSLLKSILSVFALHGSSFCITLVCAEYWTKSHRLFVMSHIMLIGPPPKFQCALSTEKIDT